LTITGLALGKFLTQNYKDETLGIIKEKKMYHDIRCAYYGGITEVYRPYGKNLYYYDVNSLYPYVALNDIPGKDCTEVDYMDSNPKLTGLFGFFYCEVEVSEDKYLGLLPYRTQDGLIFPLGK